MRLGWILGLLMMVSQAALALNVRTVGDDVVIEGAVSRSGAKAQIHLQEAGPAGRARLVPLSRALGVRVERRGRDLRIINASGRGRYQAVVIEMNDGGNRQSLRIGLGGGGQRVRPAAPPGVIPRVSRPARSSAEARHSGPMHWLNEKVTNLDLSRRDLAGSSSVNSGFERVDLHGSRLAGGQMTNTRFFQCDLHQVDFTGARLVNVRFEQSDLRGVSFRHVRMVNVRFDGSDLTGALWPNGQICKPGSVGVCR